MAVRQPMQFAGDSEGARCEVPRTDTDASLERTHSEGRRRRAATASSAVKLSSQRLTSCYGTTCRNLKVASDKYLQCTDLRQAMHPSGGPSLRLTLGRRRHPPPPPRRAACAV